MLAGARRYGWGLWGLLVLCTGCLVDTDKPCDDNEVEVDGEGTITGCVCAPGAVPNEDGHGCSPCGAHEEAMSGVCVCEEGYERANARAECEEIGDAGSMMDDEDAGEEPMSSEPTGIGEDCDTAADCAEYDATFCQNLQEPHQCLLQGCAVGDVVCPETQVCCVVDVLPQLAAANGLCVDDCVAPGMMVDP